MGQPEGAFRYSEYQLSLLDSLYEQYLLLKQEVATFFPQTDETINAAEGVKKIPFSKFRHFLTRKESAPLPLSGEQRQQLALQSELQIVYKRMQGIASSQKGMFPLVSLIIGPGDGIETHISREGVHTHYHYPIRDDVLPIYTRLQDPIVVVRDEEADPYVEVVDAMSKRLRLPRGYQFQERTREGTCLLWEVHSSVGIRLPMRNVWKRAV